MVGHRGTRGLTPESMLAERVASRDRQRSFRPGVTRPVECTSSSGVSSRAPTSASAHGLRVRCHASAFPRARASTQRPPGASSLEVYRWRPSS